MCATRRGKVHGHSERSTAGRHLQQRATSNYSDLPAQPLQHGSRDAADASCVAMAQTRQRLGNSACPAPAARQPQCSRRWLRCCTSKDRGARVGFEKQGLALAWRAGPRARCCTGCCTALAFDSRHSAFDCLCRYRSGRAYTCAGCGWWAKAAIPAIRAGGWGYTSYTSRGQGTTLLPISVLQLTCLSALTVSKHGSLLL